MEAILDTGVKFPGVAVHIPQNEFLINKDLTMFQQRVVNTKFDHL
jgi:hypothetical protein